MDNDEYRGSCKSELFRIAIQCGNTNIEAVEKFTKIVAKRIDSAYELGKDDGIKEVKIK